MSKSKKNLISYLNDNWRPLSIGGLTSLLLYNAFFYILLPLISTERFIHNNNDIKIKENIGKFRDQNQNPCSYKESGVWYTPKEITSYLRNQYKKILTEEEKNKNSNWPTKYEWVLGFYWHKNDNGKFDFYVIPTLLNTETKQVYDYYLDGLKAQKDQIYDHTGISGKDDTGAAVMGNSYDAGQLWP